MSAAAPSATVVAAPAQTRIVVVDAVRGFALFGIVCVHMVEQYLASPPPASQASFGVFSTADVVAQVVVNLLFTGKFFAMFSLLFGISFFIQMDRAAARGADFRGRFVWRLAVLAGIGVLHQLFYAGDILTIYAVLGLLLVPLYRAPDRTLLWVAAFFAFGGARLLLTAWTLATGGTFDLMPVENAALERNLERLRTASLPALFFANLAEGYELKLLFLFAWFGRGYQTLALFVLGLYAGRHRWHERVEELRRPLGRIVAWSAAGVLLPPVLIAGLVALAPPTSVEDVRLWQGVIGLGLLDVMNLSLMILFLGGFVLLYLRPGPRRALRTLAPVGRTALSNYVGQSVVGTFILYGYGLGYLGRIGAATALALAVFIFASEVVVSGWWLRRFQFGPLEWLWRSLTYLRLQPFRRSGEARAHGAPRT